MAERDLLAREISEADDLARHFVRDRPTLRARGAIVLQADEIAKLRAQLAEYENAPTVAYLATPVSGDYAGYHGDSVGMTPGSAIMDAKSRLYAEFSAVELIARPKVKPPQVAVTDEMCERVFNSELPNKKKATRIEIAAAREWLKAWQSELGPALGMTAWREPTEEECVKMCSILTDWEVRRNDGFSLSPQGITQAQEAHGRAMFAAVREVMGGGE